MNKILLYAPKFVILNYLKDNFSTVTVEEYFLLVGKGVIFPRNWIMKNEVLSRNPHVLLNEIKILDSSIDIFKNEAFTEEVINEIIKRNINIYRSYLENRPNLRKNPEIYKKLLREYTLKLSDLEPQEVDEEVLDILEKQHFEPTLEELKKYRILETRSTFIKALLKNNPESILQLDNITQEYVDIAIKNGFKATKEDYELHPSLKKYKNLLLESYKDDKSLIVFFTKDMMTYQIEYDFEKDGSYILTEQDLKDNPDIGSLARAMNYSIKQNPVLIKYVKEGAYLEYTVVEEALKQIEITEEDLEENPDLTRHADIMCRLPNLKLYSSFLPIDEKQKAIEDTLRKKAKLSERKLPFLKPKFGSLVDSDKIISLSSILTMYIEEDDIKLQKQYSDMLDMVLDASANTKYEKAKNTYKYPNIVVLNDSIISAFDEAIKMNSKEPLSSIINDIYMFTKQTMDFAKIKSTIEKYFEEYKQTNDLDKTMTINFYNEILNMHRNFHISRFKSSLEKEIQKSLELTEKKKKTIIQGRKLDYVRRCLFTYNYASLGISVEELVNLRNQAIDTILNNKDLRKKGITISQTRLKVIANSYLNNGRITKEYISEQLGITDKESINYLVKQFDKVLLKLSENIKEDEIDTEIRQPDLYRIEGLNYNNFKIANQEKIYKVISSVLMSVTEEEIDLILKQEHLEEILPLIPLVSFTSEFDVRTFINMLKTYDRVRDKISTTCNVDKEENLSSLIIKNLDDVVYLANAYASSNDIEKYALTEDTIELLEDKNVSSYARFYLMMLNRTSSHIPAVRVTTDVMSYVSADNQDPDRLAIGKKPSKDSCIDLHNSAGVLTYKELLTGSMADVIMCRNEFNKSFDNRIMIIRRGNVVQLITKAGVQGYISAEDLKQIADQIITEAIKNNDNIDYVFVNGNIISKIDYPEIEDSRFVNEFPHADVMKKATLLSSKNMLAGRPDNYEFDFKAEPKATYKHPRRKISTTPNELEITRIRALNILLTENQTQKENLGRIFEPFYMKEYIKVICGQDWYIAVKKDGSIEELTLPIITEEGIIEYENARSIFINNETKLAM